MFATRAPRTYSAPKGNSSFPVIDYELPIDPSKEQIVSLISAIFPEYDESSDCTFRQFTDGLTNRLFKIRYTTNNQKSVLIRIYGEKTELLIDREKELQSMICLHEAGLAPKVYGKFTNGVCYGFIAGTPFTVSDMKHPLKSKLVAKHLAKFHSVEIPTIEKGASLFKTLDNWQGQIEKPVQSRSREEVNRGVYSVESFNAEVAWIKEQMRNYAQWDVCFCHNDLLAGNLIYRDDGVDFIDYEYGSYNYAYFDVGNHLCEMMGPEVILGLFPSKKFQKDWISQYVLARWNQSNQEFVSQAYQQVRLMILAANLYWGVWSLVQNQFSNVEFDYNEYSQKRLHAYYYLKDLMFGKKKNPS